MHIESSMIRTLQGECTTIMKTGPKLQNSTLALPLVQPLSCFLTTSIKIPDQDEVTFSLCDHPPSPSWLCTFLSLYKKSPALLLIIWCVLKFFSTTQSRTWEVRIESFSTQETSLYSCGVTIFSNMFTCLTLDLVRIVTKSYMSLFPQKCSSRDDFEFEWSRIITYFSIVLPCLHYRNWEIF